MINPAALESYQVSTEELIRTVIRNNRLIAAGSLDTGSGRMAVKIPGLIRTADDLRDLPVKVNGDSVVTLADVASIRRTFKDRQRYARVNGSQAISLNVYKRQNANVVDTVDAVKQVVEEFRPQLPDRLDLTYTQDQAPFAPLPGDGIARQHHHHPATGHGSRHCRHRPTQRRDRRHGQFRCRSCSPCWLCGSSA